MSGSGVSIFQFIGQFFSTFLAGMIGSAEAFFSGFINSLGNLFFMIFGDYAFQLSRYSWAIPIVLVASIGGTMMVAYVELSIGKLVEDVE